MIKLNNKNITYIALADSNNSVKGVKEIWYADTNNSVKLVYRRKDALIEGEDYEKYHWLDGDGSAYIDTLVSDLTDVKNIYCKIKRPSDVSGISSQRVFGRENPSGYSGTRFVVRPYDNHLDLYISTKSYTLFTDNDDYININAESNIASTSRQSKTVEDIKTNGVSLCLFGDHSLSNFSSFYKGSVGEFTIDQSMQLIPCKLLKPVPKWLDANGIRRQVGECGMIDLVSGKFYGNVNNVGTFTVENYYERKEWLETDLPITNTTYMELPINSAIFSFNRVFEQVVNSTLFVTTKYSYYVDIVNNSAFAKIWDIPNAQEVFRATTPIVIGESISINSTESDLSINNEMIPIYENTNIIIRFRQSVTSSTLGSKFKTSTIAVNGIERYIPCTLTMDLPASMDANNIARTKGTSGMWDLVSDKFYGNVANSGTFKAVNLAEGVDYEVHDWLVVEINSVGTLQRLPINSSSMSYRVKRINGQNLHFFRTDGYDYYYRTENIHLGIYDLNQKTIIYNTSSIIDNEIDFECSAGNVSANEVDIPIYGFPIKEVRFHAADRGGMKTYTSSITVDGIERYIPVKLLRSIPSKYDANGIARNAGECGMYDTVNDKFYGNVASSGSFTVEDDS